MQLSAANDVRPMLYQSITFIFKHLANLVVLKRIYKGIILVHLNM